MANSAGSGGAAYAAGQDAAQDSALWAVLAGATDEREYCQSWLAIQCRLIPGVGGAVVLVRQESDGAFVVAAVWPDVRRDMSYLSGTAQKTLAERRGLVVPRKSGDAIQGFEIAYPIEASGQLHGVVVLDVSPRPEAEMQTALRQLHWGAAGLEALFYRHEVAREQASKKRLQSVLELVATAAAEPRYAASAMALATALATRLECERVSIGFLERGHVKVDALSHSAQVKGETNLVRAIAAAMEESIDQSAVVSFPSAEGAPPSVSRAHQALAEDGGACLSVPLVSGGNAVGAITLERAGKEPFDRETVELCEALAALAGPTLEVHRREDRWFGARFATWAYEKAAALFGPRHPGLKLATAVVLVVAALLAILRGDFRVSSSTALEPLVQQAAVAPFNGYIREAPARPGDLVKQGALLAKLDDRELKLERLKWLSQQEELAKQFRAAMADRNAAQVQIVTAQLEQARAQVERAEEQLARTDILAPFDGIVVSGDLTQQLGAPVERGTVLFEVAPLAQFRVVLKVDERDIAYLQVGQTGTLLLSAFPNEPFAFTVRKITPVSTPKDGRNYFRVEAELATHDPRMRPGMEGVGKVDIDRRNYLWIWTRQVIDSLRLALWSWLP
ncbi:MAG: efflux RND transporter periplasmic adaptor subunit [Burkholderiales bacterium]|nr:efflux RND transporter periplasmic adaptor subunit [Burkholderiales bacterium]